MEFGPKRNSVVYIFENFVKDFGLLIFALMIAVITGDFTIIFDNFVVAIIVFFGPIAKIFSYLFTYYSIDDEKLIINSGFLTKKNLEVPLSTVTTVDFTQNLVHRVFGVYRLNIDNTSNISSESTKVKMTFKKDEAIHVKQLILEGKAGIDGLNLYSEGQEDRSREDGNIREIPEKTYKVDLKDIIIMGFLKSKMVFLLGFIGVISSGFAIIGNIIDLPENQIERILVDILKSGNLLTSIITTAVVLMLIGTVCGGIGELIRYYGFQIRDNGESLKIEYGLLTKKNFTIHKRKISGFYYEQSLFMRIMKLGTLRIFAIGYGGAGDEEASEDPILLPLLKEDKLMAEMGKLIPEMMYSEEYFKPQRKSLRYFFYSYSLLFSLAVTIALAVALWNVEYASNLWILGAVLVCLSIVGIIMQYKNAGIYGNENHISISNGGFKKSTFFIKTNNIESISGKASIWKEKKGVTTISVGYIAPLIYSNQVAKNISIAAFDKIKSKLIY